MGAILLESGAYDLQGRMQDADLFPNLFAIVKNWFTDDGNLRIGRNALLSTLQVRDTFVNGERVPSQFVFIDPEPGEGNNMTVIDIKKFNDFYDQRIIDELIKVGQANARAAGR